MGKEKRKKRMKHKIQISVYRIQKAGNAQSRADAVGATPTAGDRDGRDPREVGKGGKWGVEGRSEAGFLEKWLRSITRIYTHLPHFTQRSWTVTLRAFLTGRGTRESPFSGLGIFMGDASPGPSARALT